MLGEVFTHNPNLHCFAHTPQETMEVVLEVMISDKAVWINSLCATTYKQYDYVLDSIMRSRPCSSEFAGIAYLRAMTTELITSSVG